MSQRAFSLVELSIVLVILGLLTGGILAGQSLIHASELRSLTTQFTNYTSAVQNFQTKYGAVPGDFSDGTKYWGRENSNADCITNYSAAVSSMGVCDGNADGGIGLGGAGNQASESFQFWRELAVAGMIDGKFTGIAGATSSYTSVADSNVPSTKIAGGAWFVQLFGGPVSGNTVLFDGDYANIFEVGAVTSNDPAGLLFKPEDMQNLDSKLDDGMPGTGKFRARSWSTCTTATASSQLGATYLVSSTTPLCVIIFANQF